MGTADFVPTDSSVSGEKVSNSNATDKTVSVEKEREEPRSEGEANSIAQPTKTSRKQRVPKFLRGADAVWFGGDKSNDEAALDYLYPSAKTTNANPHSEHFEQIVDETSKPSLFSLSAFLYNMESLFERIPLPLMFGILSLVIIIATANATTQWNRHEQRLAAIDKIATNAENDMLTYQLDDAINTLQELEKTEQGDLPPRARAILNQSLWLRSYAHAKKQQYAKALADLSMVTNTFISYDDVTEKSAEYKKLLAAHPEFADLSKDKGASKVASTDSSRTKSQAKLAPHGAAQLGAIQMETAVVSSKKTKTDADDSAILAAASERAMRRVAQEKAERANSVPSLRADRESGSSQRERESITSRGEREPNSLRERESSSSRGVRETVSPRGERESASSKAQRELVSSQTSQESLARVERTTYAMKTPQDKLRTAKSVSDRSGSEKEAGKSAVKRKSGKSDAALLDADMKRYSGLLVEYFSKAESGRAGGGQLTEPPSYEEWSEGGKRDF